MRMIGEFKSSADNNTRQPVKNGISQPARDLDETQPFPSFDLLLLLMLNQYGHGSA